MSDLLTISDGHLISLSGIAEFKAGLECFKSGGVRECSYEHGHVTGVVADDKLHAVQLRHTARHLEGHCDCLASSEVDFCQHCIALAMAYRQKLAKHHELASGDVLERIQAHINSMSKAELQDALCDIIEDDKNLQNSWSVRADLALNKIDTRRIRKRITATFPYNKRLHRRAQVKEYFYKAAVEIDLLKKQLPKLEGKKALQLLDYAFLRLQKALETIDDSYGHRLELLANLQKLHVETLARSDWSKNRVVQYLIELERSAAHDYYPQIPSNYDTVLGREGLDQYIAEKQGEWDRLPPLSFGADWEQLYPYLKIQVHLLKAARNKNDSFSEISLLEKTCVDPKACLNLCQRLVELELWDKLEFWLATANRWQQNSATTRHLPNLDLKRLATVLFINKGRVLDALNLQWEIYQQSESLEDYKQLVHYAKQNDSVEATKARAFRRLHKNVEEPNEGHFVQRTLNHLVQLYLLEGKPEAALDLVNYHSLSYKSLELLIKAFSSQSDIVYPLYQQQLGLLLNQANNHAYKDALGIIARCKNNLKAQETHHFDAMLESIRRDHKENTAFQKLLEDELKSYP